MGAINSAFNQALGAVAGAGLAIKHAKETEESKMNTAEHSALVARNQAGDAETEYDKVRNESFWSFDEKGNVTTLKARAIEADKAVNRAQEAFDKASNIKTRKEKFNDLAAALSARDSLRAKVEAIDNMRTRAEEQRAYADRASQIASKAQQKYQSRWGGK